MGRLEGVDVITSKALRGSMASVEFYELSCILGIIIELDRFSL